MVLLPYRERSRKLNLCQVHNNPQYFWDIENRLSSVTLPGSGGTVSFKYDPFGRRIYKSSSGGISVYAYDMDNLIEETNSAGAVVARYSQGLNIYEPLAMLRTATTSYYHADGLGSVTSLSSAAAAITQTYTFDSFGKQTASTGSLVNPFRPRPANRTPKPACITIAPGTMTPRQEGSRMRTQSISVGASIFMNTLRITRSCSRIPWA